MKILAFHNWASHDPGSCVLIEKDDQLQYLTIADERVSRVKNSYFFPIRSIKYSMDYFGIKHIRDFDLIVSDYSYHKQFMNTNLPKTGIIFSVDDGFQSLDNLK